MKMSASTYFMELDNIRKARRLAKRLHDEFGLRMHVRKTGEFRFQIVYRNGNITGHRTSMALLSELLRVSEQFSSSPEYNRRLTFA